MEARFRARSIALFTISVARSVCPRYTNQRHPASRQTVACFEDVFVLPLVYLPMTKRSYGLALLPVKSTQYGNGHFRRIGIVFVERIDNNMKAKMHERGITNRTNSSSSQELDVSRCQEHSSFLWEQ